MFHLHSYALILQLIGFVLLHILYKFLFWFHLLYMLPVLLLAILHMYELLLLALFLLLLLHILYMFSFLSLLLHMLHFLLLPNLQMYGFRILVLFLHILCILYFHSYALMLVFLLLIAFHNFHIPFAFFLPLYMLALKVFLHLSNCVNNNLFLFRPIHSLIHPL